MNKLEFRQLLEKGEVLVASGRYEDAVEIFDKLEFDHLDESRRLQNIAKAYEKCKRYEDAEEILLIAKQYAPKSRSTLFHLCTVALKEGNLESAEEYYEEFCRQAAADAERYVLQYRIAQAKGESDEKKIAILEQFKDEDPDDHWLYELAQLYAKNDRLKEAVEVFDEIALFYDSGKYWEKARDLRAEITGESAPAEEDEPADEPVAESGEAFVEEAAEEQDAEPADELTIELDQEPEEEAPEEAAEEQDAEPADELTIEQDEEPIEESTQEPEETTEEPAEETPEEPEQEILPEADEDQEQQEKSQPQKEWTEIDELADGLENMFRIDTDEPAVEEQGKVSQAEIDELAGQLGEDMFWMDAEETIGEPAEEPENERYQVRASEPVEEAEENPPLVEVDEAPEEPENVRYQMAKDESVREPKNDLTLEIEDEAVGEAEEDLSLEDKTEVSEETEEDLTLEDKAEASEEVEEDLSLEDEAEASEEAEEDLSLEDEAEASEESEEDFSLDEEEEAVPQVVEKKTEVYRSGSGFTQRVEAGLLRKLEDSSRFGNLPVDPAVGADIWHFAVCGESPELALECAKEKAREIAEQNPGCPGKLLKINANRFGSASVVKSLHYFLNNMVIVEEASGLTDLQLMEFAQILTKDEKSMLLIFTDTKEKLVELFQRVPKLVPCLTAVFEARKYTADDLVAFAKEVLFKEDARMTEDAEAYVRSYAGNLLAEKKGFYRNTVRELTLKALNTAEKGGFLGLSMGKVDDDDFLLVTARHFKKADERK